MSDTRRAHVHSTRPHEVAAYLPSNYEVVDLILPDIVVIAGVDNAGWTLDGYVIPRLASGMIRAEEVQP